MRLCSIFSLSFLLIFFTTPRIEKKTALLLLPWQSQRIPCRYKDKHRATQAESRALDATPEDPSFQCGASAGQNRFWMERKIYYNLFFLMKIGTIVSGWREKFTKMFITKIGTIVSRWREKFTTIFIMKIGTGYSLKIYNRNYKICE